MPGFAAQRLILVRFVDSRGETLILVDSACLAPDVANAHIMKALC